MVIIMYGAIKKICWDVVWIIFVTDIVTDFGFWLFLATGAGAYVWRCWSLKQHSSDLKEKYLFSQWQDLIHQRTHLTYIIII